MISLILFGCKKKPFDYRNKFIGDWNFKVNTSSFNTTTNYFHSDSLYYIGEIKYGDHKDELFIQYTSTNSLTLKIDKDDKLSDFPTQHSNGEFENKNKLKIYLKSGGLGGGSSQLINGIKL